MDLDKLSTNVRQPFLKILIGSVMASKQRTTEKSEELYLLSEVENKQVKMLVRLINCWRRHQGLRWLFCITISLREQENIIHF